MRQQTTHVLTSFMGTVSTIVYAQPLYVEKGPGSVETFVGRHRKQSRHDLQRDER
jgi:hypothetical protein